MHTHPYKPARPRDPESTTFMRLVWALIVCAAAYACAIDDRDRNAAPSAQPIAATVVAMSEASHATR